MTTILSCVRHALEYNEKAEAEAPVIEPNQTVDHYHRLVDPTIPFVPLTPVASEIPQCSVGYPCFGAGIYEWTLATFVKTDLTSHRVDY